jgi:heptosyltransferase-3
VSTEPHHLKHAIHSILIIQTKYIGDVILTSAMVRNLRLAYPDATVTMLCTMGLRQFVVKQQIVDQAIGFDIRGRGMSLWQRFKEYRSVLAEVRSRDFDLTIDLSDSKSSRLLHRLIGAPLRVGFDPPESPLKFWETQPANILAATHGHGDAHYLQRYLSPLRALGVDVADPIPRLEAGPEARAECAKVLQQISLARGTFIAVHAGARFEGRCWQPERFARVIDEIYSRTGLISLLIGGPEESATAQKIIETAVSPVRSLVGSVSLETLTALLADARIFLGNESGPMHLAASAGTPVVGIYGLTPPDIWGPLGVPNRTIAPPLPCQCVAPGRCRPNNPGGVYCVHRVKVVDVAIAAFELLQASGLLLDHFDPTSPCGEAAL